jgi:hypothetical protein
MKHISLIVFLLVSFLLLLEQQGYAQKPWQSRHVKISTGGSLKYIPDSLGNFIPDFSGVGYNRNRTKLPEVKVMEVIEANGVDDQERIQAAINKLSLIPVGKDGFRGAILLKAGTFKIPGSIRISASGIVLKGEGDSTKIIGTGKGKRSLIIAKGSGRVKEINGTRENIKDNHVPVGSKSFRINNAHRFKAGDSIIVFRPATQNWIDDIRMNQIDVRDSNTRQWDTEEYGLHYERIIVEVKGDLIFIDNPIVMGMEEKYGGGEVYKYTFPGRIRNVGVENLVCISEYEGKNDEDHAWDAIHFNELENGWVSNVTAYHFGYSCVNLGYQARNVTVTDCKYLEPVSLITGSRRYSFNNDGQLNLVMHCFASEGRHDYVTGARVCGPNVFFDCKTEKSNGDIGPHHRWASGTLYDNIVTDGEINVQDRGNWGTGHGWSGVTQVIWNCKVKRAAIQDPWTSGRNYVIALTGESYQGRLKGRPMTEWEGKDSNNIQPASLYLAQLEEAKKKE